MTSSDARGGATDLIPRRTANTFEKNVQEKEQCTKRQGNKSEVGGLMLALSRG